MNSKLFPKSTFAQLPENCCTFSKPEFDYIRNDFEEGRIFDWLPIYEAIPPKLLKYRNNRKELVERLYDIATKHDDSLLKHNLSYYEEMRADGSTKRMTDICPFSVLATFSLDTSTEDRWPVVRALGDLFEVEVSEPSCFHGVPALPFRNPRFYKRQPYERGKNDIDVLWRVFETSAEYAKDMTDDNARDAFIHAFNAARDVKQTKWNLTIGLFWSNPHRFLTLDIHSRAYIRDPLGITFFERLCTGGEYVVLMDRLKTCNAMSESPFNNYIELSRTARKAQEDKKNGVVRPT